MAKSAHVVHVESKDFEESVLRESWRRPVVVDFWAAWCAPCRMLAPVLERLAEEFKGAFLLVKVDTDANLELSQRFRIRSIPNVKVFRDGDIADEFVGVMPEAELHAFLRRHCPTEADRHYQDALLELKVSRHDRARKLLGKALELDPAHAGALLELGKMYAVRGDLTGAQSCLDRVPPASPLREQAETLKEALQFQMLCVAGGGSDGWARKVAAEPENLEARYAYGCCLTAAGDYRNALEEFLHILARDRNFKEQAARKAMLTVFRLVGERSELAEEYRKKLALRLY